MSELEAKERYYWSKIRQALKEGNTDVADREMRRSFYEAGHEMDLYMLTVNLKQKVAKTFTAGCIALGDPAQPEQEKNHD